ncbi:MAG: phospholipase A [Burkholderiales bacterium]|nr:phospholipase A [Burkholderiales bacterium]
MNRREPLLPVNWRVLALAGLLGAAAPGGHAAAPAGAPAGAPLPDPLSDSGWRACSALADGRERLACFDQWAALKTAASTREAAAATPAAVPPQAEPVVPTPAAPVVTPVAESDGCHDPRRTEMSRFWELEDGSDCGTFRFRGYRPVSASVVMGDSVNRQPSSPSAGRSATTPQPYRHVETRVQLSVRTKLAQGLLVHDASARRDSLWFGYTQQSYWQLFSGEISRPFRTTDHEPELIYVYPSDLSLPWNWRLRYSGVGLVHQSNGQTQPLSRSWNRVYLMAGAELGNRWMVQGRVWERVRESSGDDDNPGIGNTVGRAEVRVQWNVNVDNTLGLTVRHALTRSGAGSTRLEWLRTLGDAPFGRKSNLRLHTQLFSGYGDSLVDYNRRRTTFSVGLSLLDF